MRTGYHVGVRVTSPQLALVTMRLMELRSWPEVGGTEPLMCLDGPHQRSCCHWKGHAQTQTHVHDTHAHSTHTLLTGEELAPQNRVELSSLGP